MTDTELLDEALQCIYEIRGAYLNYKDPSYERHRKDIEELEATVLKLEKRLGINNHAK